MNQWVLILLSVPLENYKDCQIYVMVIVYLILKHEQVTGAVSLVWNCARYESFVITVIIYQCTAFLKQVFGMKTVTLEVTQPASTGPVCPGQEIILTCNVTQTGTVQDLNLNWKLQSLTSTDHSLYDINNPQSGPQTLGDFITTAVFMITTEKGVIVSNATLKSAAVLSNNNSVVTCKSPPQDNVQTVTITIAGRKNCATLQYHDKILPLI